MAKDRIGRGVALLLGVAYGAGMMYLLDPDLGRDRRRLIRSRLLLSRNRVQRWVLGRLRHAAGELRGSIVQMRSKMREGPVPDRTLERRVRAQLTHVVAHPRSLAVSVQNGHVTIRGLVETGERERILDRLSAIRGIFEFTLEITERPTSAKEGERRPPEAKAG